MASNAMITSTPMIPIGNGLRSRNGFIGSPPSARHRTGRGGATERAERDRQASHVELAEPEVEVPAVGRGADEAVQFRGLALKEPRQRVLAVGVLGGVEVVGDPPERPQIRRQV